MLIWQAERRQVPALAPHYLISGSLNAHLIAAKL